MKKLAVFAVGLLACGSSHAPIYAAEVSMVQLPYVCDVEFNLDGSVIKRVLGTTADCPIEEANARQAQLPDCWRIFWGKDRTLKKSEIVDPEHMKTLKPEPMVTFVTAVFRGVASPAVVAHDGTIACL